MKLYDILKERKISAVLKEKFPDLFEYSKKVEVIPWQEEFEAEDKNPEVIDEIEFLTMLLDNDLISQDEYQRRLSMLPPAKKTLGIALMHEDKVSFRSYPSDKVLLHELGHCFFKEPDSVWNEVYGGGELLMWVGLQTELKINERSIIFYHNLLRKILHGKTKEAHEIIIEKLEQLELPCVPHVIAFSIFAGTIPPDVPILDPEDTNILSVEVKPHHLQSFLVNTLTGVLYKDFTCISFAKALFVGI